MDRLDEAVKLYITRLTRGGLDEREGRRATEFISFSINLEHVGQESQRACRQKIKRKLQFLEDGMAELLAFHKRILESLRLALGTFMSGDVNGAQKLIAEKGELRIAELAAADNHLARLREGRPESIESSSLHLDILRDLNRIHSHICSVAYPILESACALQSGREPAWRAHALRESGSNL